MDSYNIESLFHWQVITQPVQVQTKPAQHGERVCFMLLWARFSRWTWEKPSEYSCCSRFHGIPDVNKIYVRMLNNREHREHIYKYKCVCEDVQISILLLISRYYCWLGRAAYKIVLYLPPLNLVSVDWSELKRALITKSPEIRNSLTVL